MLFFLGLFLSLSIKKHARFCGLYHQPLLWLSWFLFGTLLNCFAALGEEIGWRGFLVTELSKHVSFTKTSIISGVIWAGFHFPLLVVTVAPRLGVSVWLLIVFTVTSGIGLSCMMAWLRLKSGSVWTAVIFHAALNIHIQGFFQPLTLETSNLTNYVSGEQGLMMALVAAIGGYLFWRKRSPTITQV